VYNAAAQFYRTRRYPQRRKQVKTNGCAHNVDNRINCAYFVKGNVVKGHAVYFRFRRRNERKNIEGARFNTIFKGSAFYQGAYFFPGIMGVFVRVCMAMLVIMHTVLVVRVIVRMLVMVIVFMCVMLMAVAVIMCMLVMIMRVVVTMRVVVRVIVRVIVFRQNNMCAGTMYAAAFFFGKIKLPPGHAKFGKFSPQYVGIYSQINKSAQRHIAGDAGKAIKVQCFHVAFPFARPRARLRFPIR
jgi:hypothetical protein